MRCYMALFSPINRWTQIEPLLVKDSIQEAFEIWGRPRAIRVDNGSPWGTSSAVPSALALWIVGLGTQVFYGRPRCSTDNGLVERCHGVLDKWVAPETQADFAACQERLEGAIWTQRERYRSPHHETRAQAYPQLYENLRTYSRREDEALWELKRVARFLSAYTFERKVEKNGRITLMANSYSVGREYAGQVLSVSLSLSTQKWIVNNDYGDEITQFESKELDYEKISNLQLAKRRKK